MVALTNTFGKQQDMKNLKVFLFLILPIFISCTRYAGFSGYRVAYNNYEPQCLIALAYYPELKDCKIGFLYSNISTTMSCRPSIKSLIIGEREYQIFINDYSDFEGILLQDVPLNAQIGIIGHEIAHILDYEDRNLAGIIQIGIK
jgi:hypothetical protein